MPSTPIIEVNHLYFSYKKTKPILKDVSLQISAGEKIAITGRSGAGKTTLAYILKGVIPHSVKGHLSGTVIADGHNMPKTPMVKTAQSVGIVFQDLNAQLFSNTVREEIEFGLKNLKMDPKLAQTAMKQMNIVNLANEIPMNLSAGQKQRVILASVLAMQPKILILDEPSVHLDIQNKEMLRDWLLDLNRTTGVTILIASNEPWLIGEICESILVVDNGHVSRKTKAEVIERRPEWGWKE